MAHVEWKNIWKTAVPPRLLAYVYGRLADLQSWLRSEEKREEMRPGRNAAYFRAWLTFSPFKCSRLVPLAHTAFSTLKNAPCDPTPRGCSLWSSDGVTVFETVMSQVEGLGLPKEQPRVGMF